MGLSNVVKRNNVAIETLSLQLAQESDAGLIHSMQVLAFRELLEKYQDFQTNPGAETVDRIVTRIRQPHTRFYIAFLDQTAVGAVRVILLDSDEKCRVSPIFVLPEFQNRKIAQSIFASIEQMHKPKNGWMLETIEEEAGNCHLYEKIGYRKTGKTDVLKPGMTLVHYEKVFHG